MKNVFFCFTPYHIRIANMIAKELSNNENHIIFFQNSKIESYINKKLFKSVEAYFLDDLSLIKTKQYFLDFKLIIKLRQEMRGFCKYIDEIKVDRIFTFSDNPIYFQKVFNNSDAKIILVEEGLGIYNDYYKLTLKEKLKFFIQKYGHGYSKAKLFPHGKGNYEDYLVAREVDLIKNNSKKIKMDREFFKLAFNNNLKDIKKIKELCLEKGYLYCPAGTVYEKDKMIKFTNNLFNKFFKNKVILYIKLHPREPYYNEIKQICNKYQDYIRIIEDYDITSEDIILNGNIRGIISDFSSMLMNAVYLKEDLEIYTTLDLLYEEYGVSLNLNLSIFKFLKEKEIIKDFRELEIKIGGNNF